MKYIVYVIQNDLGKKYTGYTSNINHRLWQHNNGVTRSTRNSKNWEIIFTKEFLSKTEAIKYESFLKTGKGRDLIKKLVSGAAGSSNGRTADSESVYLGPNPSPAALLTSKNK